MQTIKISDKAYKIIMRHVNQMGDETIVQAVDELTENAFGTVWVDMKPNYQKDIIIGS